MRDVQALFVWLQRRGWSQAQIASLTGQSQPEVSAIIKGRKVTAYPVLLRVADGSGIPRGYLGLSSCIACDGTGPDARSHDTEGDDPMFRRAFLAAAGAVAAGGALDGVQRLFPDPVPSARALPARVGVAEVAQVRATIAHFRALDYRHGYGSALDAARGYFGWANGLLGARMSEATARDLRIVLADLHVMIAFDYHEGGRPTGARRHHAQALVLAREAEEPALVGTILSDTAIVSMDNGDPREAIRLAGFGLLATDTDGVTPAVHAMLRLQEALARARLADERGVRDALSRADDDVARTDAAAVPPWASSAYIVASHPGAHAGMRAHALAELARTPAFRGCAQTAVENAGTAIAAYDGQRSWTGHAFDRMYLASAQLRAGGRDEGLATANDLLDQAAATLSSPRSRTRLTGLADAAHLYTGHSDADDLRSRIAALTAA